MDTSRARKRPVSFFRLKLWFPFVNVHGVYNMLVDKVDFVNN